MEQPPKQVKPFLEYGELVDQLSARGMSIEDRERAIRKITQVGYYRLSGYWHVARRFETHEHHTRTYLNEFRHGTSFNAIYELYTFDKRLRLELLDALERIEVYFRTVIAHELGRNDPLCHLDKMTFSKDSCIQDEKLRKGPSYHAWLERHQRQIQDSQEDSIVSHRNAGKPIPIWAAAEVWDFGSLSKFYSMLSVKNQDLVCARVGITERNVLDNWLINLNMLRNRCAHHSRVCNRPNPRTLKLAKKGYFNLLELDAHGCEKIFGLIAVIWFLLKQIGRSSDWILRIANLIDQKPNVPGLTFKSMGITTGDAFPRERFPEAKLPPTPVINFYTFSSLAKSSANDCVNHLKADDCEPGSAAEAHALTEVWLQAIVDIEMILKK
jgi:abortive infection bacteriophage resistance protein